MFMGASHNALWAFNARVSLTRLRVVASKPLRLLCGVGGGRSAFPYGKSILAHPPHGSEQTERVRLPYAAPVVSRRAFFVKELCTSVGAKAWKGGKPPSLSGAVLHRHDGMNELCLQTALHGFVHSDVRISVPVIERPGAERPYVALVVRQHAANRLGVASLRGVDDRKRQKLFTLVGCVLQVNQLPPASMPLISRASLSASLPCAAARRFGTFP